MEESRPNPDALLAAIDSEKPGARRGRLKIFFGMAPGVGKTYAMLEAAHREKKEGADIVAGIVETHGRTETLALLEGITVLPRTRIEYRGATLEEMDLDAILKRRPEIVLVDELAHTNVPGSRHAKRYQDVLELLDAGISVYSTLNVQHVESRIDVVRQITGAPVRETVPDAVLDQADQIQLIDLEPEELLRRLSEGKVYLGDRVEAAAQHFFKPGNLAALREMSLRVTAEQVDQDLRHFMRERHIEGPWKSSERLLVAIGPSPFSGSLVRWTRRVAGMLDASWVAVHVETGGAQSEEERRRVSEHLSLARKLGADVVTIPAPGVSEAVLRVAREENVTQIIIGKPQEPAWRRMLRGGTLVDDLLHGSGDIDVYVVRPEKAPASLKREPAPVVVPPLAEWLWGAGLIVAVTLIGLFLREWSGYRAVSLFYLLTVVLAALRLPRSVVLGMAAASALLWNFLFVPPRFTFVITEFHDGMMFVSMFVVALAMGHVTSRLRQREAAERGRERRTAALLKLTEQCALENNPERGLVGAMRQIEEIFETKVAVFIRTSTHQLPETPSASSSWIPGAKENAVAAWVFQNRQPAGKGTDTLPNAEGLFVPLQTRASIMGVMGLKTHDSRDLQFPDRQLLEAFAAQIGSTLERDHFRQAFEQASLREASDRLRHTLLDNVSHELKTPLAVLHTAVGMLKPKAHPDPALLSEMNQAVRRLDRVVGLLLDSAKIETGHVVPHKEWCDLGELVEEVLSETGARKAGRKISVQMPEQAATIETDPQLLHQLLVHLVNNALTHTPGGTALEIIAVRKGDSVAIHVRDDGPGLADTVRIFDKFHRGEKAATGGVGLGLSIARGLAQALGGTLEARNRPEGGAEFVFSFPQGTMAPPAP